MSLEVTYLEIEDDNEVAIEPEAWRVAVRYGTERGLFALPLEFASERDALRAKAALEGAALENGTDLKHAGKDAVVRIMIESLAW